MTWVTWGTWGAGASGCNCVDRNELGRSTWYLLHEIVKLPPSPVFASLMWSLSELYPCKVCQVHLVEYLHDHPPEMSEQWLCKFHNVVNLRLGKAEYECIKPWAVLGNE